MYEGSLVFTQIMNFVPWHTFRRCVDRYRGEYKVKHFRCSEQYRCMAFAQLSGRESLRDIEICLRTHSHKLYHMGIYNGVSRNTLANANRVRDWRIHADFAQRLLHTARGLHRFDDSAAGLDQTVYALDSSTIDLCLSIFPWAKFRKTKSAVKLHTLLDLRGNIPAFIHISDGKLHDVNILDRLVPEPDSFYCMDRAYLDFERLQLMNLLGSFFVLRAKSNICWKRVYSHRVDRSTGLVCDQTIRLTGTETKDKYPGHLRRVVYHDRARDKKLEFLTNNFELPALTIAELYKSRWQVELFFKWIKQHLHIKSFYGESENALKTQIWIAISVYALVAIIRKRLQLEVSLYTFLQALSLSLFEKISLNQLLIYDDYTTEDRDGPNQLFLFD